MSREDFTVTPWYVEGNIDYNKLIEQFGTERISEQILDRLEKITGDIHFMLKRGIFFSHRDLNKILDTHEQNNEFFVYTGRGPSGNTHIGHLIPWVLTKWIQDKFHTNVYFQLSDDEKFFANKDITLDMVSRFTYENIIDFIALGFKPHNTKIIINTKNIGNLYPTTCQIAKKINLSNIKAVFGFTNDTNIGMIFYTALQSAPCFIENKPVLIPLGIDQDPHFRITRDVAPKIGKIKPAIIHGMMMPSLMGVNNKMSTSKKNSVIYTTDSPSTVKNKINKYAFSGGQSDIKLHRKKGGDPKIDISYQYLRMFFEPNDSKLKKIHDDYTSGRLLTGELKSIAIEKINNFLEIHQQRRKEAVKYMKEYILQ